MNEDLINEMPCNDASARSTARCGCKFW